MTPRPLSIRTRLALWYTAALLAVLAVVSVFSYSILRRSVFHDLDSSLLAVATVIRDVGGAPSGRPPDPAIENLLGAEASDKVFQVIDVEGRPGWPSPSPPLHPLPLSVPARERAERGRPTFETIEAVEGRLRLVTMPVTQDGRLAGFVQVAVGAHRAYRLLERYVEALLILIPLGLGLAAGGGALIAGRALRPVDEMSRTARRITGEDLTERVPLRGTGDELDRLAGTLNAMLGRLDEAFAQVRRFAADAAHELRTPLTALRGEVEVALRAQRAPDEYRRVLRSALEEVEHLVGLADDLLLLSRFSAGGRPPPTPVDLEPLVVDVLDLGARLAKGRGVAVRLAGASPAVVAGEPVALRRALVNLVENAVKYTPDGGTVELALGRDGGHAVIAVRDTGLGIATADLARIFEPFVRLDPARARATGGAGLGLSMARSIVEAHGGTLTAVSAPNAGSTFTIRLPLVTPAAA